MVAVIIALEYNAKKRNERNNRHLTTGLPGNKLSIPADKELFCGTVGKVKAEMSISWMTNPHYEFSPQTLDQKDSVENE